jgi:hypothetical protein
LGILAVLILAGAGLGASPLSFSAGSSAMLTLNLDPEAGKVNFPLDVNYGLTAGLGLDIEGSGLLSFEPRLMVYRSWYYWTDSGKAVPVDVDNREVWLMGAALDLPLGLALPLGKNLDFTASLGLGFNLRLGIKAESTVSDARVSQINDYLWAQGRFFTPTTALGLRFRVNEGLVARLGAKAWWPIYNLWAGEGLGFFDQGMATVDFSFSWSPRAPKGN